MNTGRFHGRTALVTGGGRSLGKAVAVALVGDGAAVHVFDAALPAAPVDGLVYHAVDITDTGAIADALASFSAAPDLLVNNAGITRDRTIAKMTDDEWTSVLQVNLTGAFNMIRATSAAMRAAGYGRIVSITSINGLRGKFGQANYAASKAGLIGLTKTAAKEFGAKGITVNAVAPGMVLTDMVLALAPEFRDAALKETALKELATPDDIAAAVLFLLSDDARMITGEVLKVDAGQYI